MLGLHKNRPLHLHAVEPGNLACSYWRSVRIVLIDCQSKRRDVYTAAQRRRSDVVVLWKFFTGRVSPNENLTQLLLRLSYIPYIRITALPTYSGVTLFLLYSINTCRTAPTRSQTVPRRRKAWASWIYPPLPLYTLIHPACSNTLAAQVLGLGTL